jgi:hypothetical protein
VRADIGELWDTVRQPQHPKPQPQRPQTQALALRRPSGKRLVRSSSQIRTAPCRRRRSQRIARPCATSGTQTGAPLCSLRKPLSHTQLSAERTDFVDLVTAS